MLKKILKHLIIFNYKILLNDTLRGKKTFGFLFGVIGYHLKKEYINNNRLGIRQLGSASVSHWATNVRTLCSIPVRQNAMILFLSRINFFMICLINLVCLIW